MLLPARGGAGRLTLKANGGEEISQRHTLGLIFVGGFTGTIARALLQTIIPGGDWPWATFAVNLTGAFALGMVSEYVIVSRASQDRRTAVRFALGTGLLGSFTTYSALAHQVAAAPAVSGLGYGLASVAGGVLLAGAGIAVGRRLWAETP